MGLLQLLRSIAMVSVITSGLTIATSFIFSLWMTKEDFGEYTYWYSIYLILLNFVQFGAVAAATVYRYQEKYIDYQNIMARTLYVIVPVSLLVVYIVYFLFDFIWSDKKLSATLYLAPLSAYFYTNVLVVIAMYRTEQNMRSYSILFISLSVSLFVIQIMSFYFFESYYYVIVAFLFVQALFFIYATLLLIRHKGIKPFLLFNKKGHVVDRFKYGLPIVFSSASMSALSMADRFYLKEHISQKEYGIYSTVVLVSSLMLFVANNFAMAWGGFLFKKISSMNAGEIKALFFKGQKLILPASLIGAAGIVPMMIYIHYIFYGVVDEKFKIALIAISLGYIVYGVSKYYIGYMMAYKKNGHVLIATLFGVLAVIICLYINYFNSLVTASLAIFLGFLVQLFYVFLFVNFKLSRDF